MLLHCLLWYVFVNTYYLSELYFLAKYFFPFLGFNFFSLFWEIESGPFGFQNTEGMNGDQGTARNNAFLNVPKKYHHSQEINFSFHSLPFLFCREIKNKSISY